MLTTRKSNERGRANHGWLDSHHSFSFADYYDAQHMGFGALRVINDDRVAGGGGFPSHPHRDMEIISYVVEGALEHRDSMGNGSVIRPGDVQVMSAGTGVAHSEFNGSLKDRLRFLQIWILPNARGLEPRYAQVHFPPEERQGKMRMVASPDAAQGSVRINQDVVLYAALLDAAQVVSHTLAPGRRAWLQVVEGELDCNGTALREGDGLAIENEERLTMQSASHAHFLLFDIA